MDESQQQRYRIEHSGQRPDDRSRQERSRSIEANPVNPRYSYMDGPNESDIPTLTSVSANTRSQISRPENLPAILQEPPHSPYPVEKPSADRAVSPYNFPPPLETHPAHFAPYADSTVRDTVHSALNPPQAPHSASPIPSKVQMGSPGVESTTADNTDEAHAFRASQTGQTGRESQWSLPQPTHAPVYNPESLSGPNGVTPANHQPGQSVHPNMELNDGQWRHGLCGCETSICALGICCPCVLYGKTEYRLSQRAAKKDPTDLLGYKACNGGCTLMAVACGFQWILAAIERTRIRKAFSLEGSIGSDCLTSLCCCCCALMQNEREVRDREELIRRYAGPATGAGTAAYVAPGPMVYAPPPR